MQDCILKIKEYEELFADNEYKGHTRYPYTVWKGKSRILLSAPHAVNHWREGKVKCADLYTGSIVKYLSKTTNCYGIASTKFTRTDANYDDIRQSAYKRYIERLIKDKDIKFVLDIHGSAKTRDFAVEIGTSPNSPDGPSFKNNSFIVECVQSILEKHFINTDVRQKEVWVNKVFTADHKYTITNYISHTTDAACIQLEINGNYRDPRNTRAFKALIEGLEEIILLLAEEIEHN